MRGAGTAALNSRSFRSNENCSRTHVINGMKRARQFVAVTGLAALLAFSGCATHKDAIEIKAKLADIEGQQRKTEQFMSRVDSLMKAGSATDNQSLATVRATTDELSQQMSQLLNNFNDLMQQVQDLRKGQTTIVRTPPRDSDANGSAGPTSAQCDLAFEDAFVLLRKGEYNRSIDSFRVFLKVCPNHRYTENAYYWIGECYYSTEKYTEAIAEFDYILANFKNSANTARTLYKLGRSKQELGKKDEAKKIYQRLTSEFSGTLEAEQAKERLKDLK